MLLLELLYRLQNSNTSLLFWNLFTGLKVYEWVEYKIISLTKCSRLLSHRISMILYLFSLLMVTTHALRLISLLSNHHHRSVTHRSFRHTSPDFWNQLPTLLRNAHPNYSSPSQRPSFKHAGLTCYTHYHHFFTLSSKPTFSVCRTDLMALDRSPDLFAHRFLCSAPFCLFYLFLSAADKVGQLLGALQGGPKSKPLPIFQKIVLKIAKEIKFLRRVKVCIKHYNTIRW